MYGIFQKKFEELTESDISELVYVKQLREDIHLDYKQGIPNDDDLLNDVCSFANSQGGYVLIGVSENKEREEGYPKKIIGLNNAEAIEKTMREKIKDNINPQLINCKSKIFTIVGKKVLLVSIPNSPNKPHYARLPGYQPFPIRQSRNKSYWSMNEVRNQIIARMDSEYRLNNEIENIHQNNLNVTSPHPILSIVVLPTFFGQEIIDPGHDDIKSFVTDNKNAFNYKSNSELGINGDIRYCIQGIEKLQYQSVIDPGTYRFLRIHRNGALEYSRASISKKIDSTLYINPQIINSSLRQFILCYKELYQMISMYDSVTISLFLKNITGAKIYRGKMPDLGINTSPISWPKSILDIRVNIPPGDEVDVSKLLSDRFYNAFGFEYFSD